MARSIATGLAAGHRARLASMGLLCLVAFLCARVPTASAVVTFVGSNANDNSSGTAGGAAVPAATAVGDVMIVTLRTSAQIPSAPAGWTQLNSSISNKKKTWWKLAVAGDAGSSINFTWPFSAIWGGILSVYSGADITNPIGNNSSVDQSNSTTIPLPDVAVTVDGSMRYSSSSSGQVAANSFSSPGMTVIDSSSRIVSTGASYEAVNAGPTATRTHQRGSAGGTVTSETVIINPSADRARSCSPS